MMRTQVTTEQELAILAAMHWDGKSAAYPIVQSWLKQALAQALLTVELSHGKLVTDDMREALEKADWARDYVPGSEPEHLKAKELA
jgi:hypothetical protein